MFLPMDINMPGPHPPEKKKPKKEPAAKKEPPAKKETASKDIIAKLERVLKFATDPKTIAIATAALAAAKAGYDLYSKQQLKNSLDEIVAKAKQEAGSDAVMRPTGFYQRPQPLVPFIPDLRDYDYTMVNDYGERRSLASSIADSSISNIPSLGSMASVIDEVMEEPPRDRRRKASQDINDRLTKKQSTKEYAPMVQKRIKQPNFFKDKRRQIL
jgi:hypothetical protein